MPLCHSVSSSLLLFNFLLLHLLLPSSNWYNISWSSDTAVSFCLLFCFFFCRCTACSKRVFVSEPFSLYVHFRHVPCVALSAANLTKDKVKLGSRRRRSLVKGLESLGDKWFRRWFTWKYWICPLQTAQVNLILLKNFIYFNAQGRIATHEYSTVLLNVIWFLLKSKIIYICLQVQD